MANKEIGRIGQRRYGGTIYEEFLHELRGTRGIEVYREMSENDDVVGAILFAIEMLVRQCDWNVEPGGDTAKDKEAAEFVESCMHDMQDTWTDTISEILSFLTYGWSFHEIVYKRRTQT
nr:MAG TPA: Portal protein [Caudoviricetes sp.]